MPSLDPGEDSEPNVLSTLDVDKAFKYIVRWLRNSNITQYFEDHPAARDTIVTTVQEATIRPPRHTSASTSSDTIESAGLADRIIRSGIDHEMDHNSDHLPITTELKAGQD